MTASSEPRLDHRKAPRRRGAELEQAILRAAVDELFESGFEGLTMDRIATRARTSKAALYRRWANRSELIVQACRQRVHSVLSTPDTGDLRSDVIEHLRSLAGLADSVYGEVTRGLLVELPRNEELARAVREQLPGLSPVVVEAIIERAVRRGEARPGVLGTRAVSVANDLLRHEFLLWGTPIPDEVITGIVDEVFLPLIRA